MRGEKAGESEGHQRQSLARWEKKNLKFDHQGAKEKTEVVLCKCLMVKKKRANSEEAVSQQPSIQDRM